MPDTNAAEAAVVEDLEVISVSSLAEAAAFFAGVPRHRSGAVAACRNCSIRLCITTTTTLTSRSGDG